MHTSNRFRERLEQDAPVAGAITRTASPRLVEVYGEMGLDFAWVDLEHGGPSPYDTAALEQLARAAEAGGIDLVVRVPVGEPAVVRSVVDAGVRNVLVPRVETAAEVRTAVAAARFGHDGAPGDRGLASVRANTWGARREGYPEREDDTVCVGVMVENRAAVDDVEAILDVTGLGFAFVGFWDLSVSYGKPFATDDEAVLDAESRVLDACAAAGVPAGRVALDAATLRAARDDGYRMFVVGNEVDAVRKTFGRDAPVREALDDAGS